MKIYVNKQYEIISIDNVPKSYGYIFETEKTKEVMFGNWCDTCIQGFKYQPQYVLLFNEDGSNKRDEETGELLYKTDNKGEKIFQGYACYPFVDYKTLMLIQKQYEDSQKKEKALTAKIEYLSMMTGVKTEVGNE